MNSEASKKKAVREVIQKYIDGTYTANIPMLESVFHEKAVMNGYLGTNLITASPSPFIEDIASAPSMKSNNDPFEAEITSIQIEGNTASVALYETGFRGETALVDFFHLIRVGEKWLIVSKLFTTL